MATTITIRNQIYDVTSYLNDHPGGSTIIEDWNGKDATVEFESIGHSEEARALLSTFHVRTLSPSDEGYLELPEKDYAELSKVSTCECIYKLSLELYQYLCGGNKAKLE